MTKTKTEKPVAAIYVRYQSQPSRDGLRRQISSCRTQARAKGLTVRRHYVDVSGSRDGRAEMLEAARRGEFGTVVVENVDRLARELGDLRTTIADLGRHGVRVVAPGPDHPRAPSSRAGRRRANR